MVGRCVMLKPVAGARGPFPILWTVDRTLAESVESCLAGKPRHHRPPSSYTDIVKACAGHATTSATR